MGYQEDIRNERIDELHKRISGAHEEMVSDFMENVVARTKKRQQEAFTRDLLEKIMYDIEQWQRRHFAGDKFQGFYPQFGIRAETDKQKLTVVPVNMAAHTFIHSINALRIEN